MSLVRVCLSQFLNSSFYVLFYMQQKTSAETAVSMALAASPDAVQDYLNGDQDTQKDVLDYLVSRAKDRADDATRTQLRSEIEEELDGRN